MKKKLAIFLLASMVMSFSACAQQQEKKSEESKSEQTPASSEPAQDRETVYQVALL